MRNQRTIEHAVECRGRGLHSGDDCTVTISPAEVGTGVVFVRADLEGRPRVPARIRHARRTQRQTVLADGPVEVQTVEHLLAVLAAFRLDNVEITMDAPEVPGGDGSAQMWVEALANAGRIEQKAPRKEFALDEPIVVGEGDRVLVALPNDEGLRIAYTLQLPPDAGLGVQHFDATVDEATFTTEIAPARTFCLKSEAEELRARGFGRGADTQNTLIVAGGVALENDFRLPEELARHKALDLIGDLALLGCDLRASVMGTRSGHADNLELVRKLAGRIEQLEELGVIQGDTGLDVKEIMKIIPHRYPFLFLDRVVEIDGFQRAVAIKNVTFNEPHFQGHWPDQPIMPGVLQVEALAQLAGVLLIRRIENTGKIAVLLSIDRIKFRRPVVPGDQLRLECETLNIRSKSGKVIGRGSVNGELTVEAVLKFMLMDE